MLRHDDHGGLRPSDVRFDDEGMYGQLHRSKTTGGDKAVRTRPINVSTAAYNIYPGWLSTGFRLLMDFAPGERDFLLPSPSEKGKKAKICSMSHIDSTILSHQLFRVLTVPTMDGWTRLFDPNVPLGHWREHSYRSFLPSAAAALKWDRADTDFLGCWRAQGGAAYSPTVRTKIFEIQSSIRRLVEEGHASRRLDDNETLRGLRVWLEDVGCTPEVIFQQLRAFRIADDMLTKRIFGLPRWQDPALHPGPLGRRPVDDQEHAAPAVAVGASHREEQRGLEPSSCVSSRTGQGARCQAAAEQLPAAVAVAAAADPQDGSRVSAAVPVAAAGPQDEDREQEDPLLVTMGFITRDEWIHLKAQPLSRFRETILPRLPARCYLCRHIYGRTARVHRLGSCDRMPGIDYGNFEHVGEAPTRVEGEKFLFCNRCFFTGAPSTYGESSSSEGSSSGSQDGRGTHEGWVFGVLVS